MKARFSKKDKKPKWMCTTRTCKKAARFDVEDLYVKENHRLCGRCLTNLSDARKNIVLKSEEKLTMDDVKFYWQLIPKRPPPPPRRQ